MRSGEPPRDAPDPSIYQWFEPDTGLLQISPSPDSNGVLEVAPIQSHDPEAANSDGPIFRGDELPGNLREAHGRVQDAFSDVCRYLRIRGKNYSPKERSAPVQHRKRLAKAGLPRCAVGSGRTACGKAAISFLNPRAGASINATAPGGLAVRATTWRRRLKQLSTNQMATTSIASWRKSRAPAPMVLSVGRARRSRSVAGSDRP